MATDSPEYPYVQTGDPNMKDFSGKTALDYAVEKGLHYCGLILTKAVSTDTADESVLCQPT